jgi:hypothetical protein
MSSFNGYVFSLGFVTALAGLAIAAAVDASLGLDIFPLDMIL